MKNLAYLFGTIAIVAFSCTKPEVAPPPSPDAAALTNFQSENIASITQHFTRSANSTMFITGEKGTRLYLPADALIDSDGNLVTGNVDIELIELNKKSEMVLLNKATNGITLSGVKAPLVSLGEFYVSISQYGTELTLTTPLQLSAPADEYSSITRKFNNISADGEDLLWEMATDSIIIFAEDSSAFMMDFQILPNEWGWVNCDYFYDDPRTKTTITITLPEGFDGSNTSVFISINGEMSLISYYSGLQLPIGLEVNFIAFGLIDDVIHYDINSATIVGEHTENMSGFTTISEDGLVDLIDDLP